MPGMVAIPCCFPIQGGQSSTSRPKVVRWFGGNTRGPSLIYHKVR